jgi:RimJ/RimL family protein N-acetyltransferase
MMKGPNGTTDFVICLKEADNKPIGKNGVWSGDEIGFILHRSQWGKGLAKEAVTKILPYLFDVRKMENITSDVDPRNQASIGLLKKFGFEEVGYREKTFQIGEEWVDSVDLKLSKEQWQRHSVS